MRWKNVLLFLNQGLNSSKLPPKLKAVRSYMDSKNRMYPLREDQRG